VLQTGLRFKSGLASNQPLYPSRHDPITSWVPVLFARHPPPHYIPSNSRHQVRVGGDARLQSFDHRPSSGMSIQPRPSPLVLTHPAMSHASVLARVVSPVGLIAKAVTGSANAGSTLAGSAIYRASLSGASSALCVVRDRLAAALPESSSRSSNVASSLSVALRQFRDTATARLVSAQSGVPQTRS